MIPEFFSASHVPWRRGIVRLLLPPHWAPFKKQLPWQQRRKALTALWRLAYATPPFTQDHGRGKKRKEIKLLAALQHIKRYKSCLSCSASCFCPKHPHTRAYAGKKKKILWLHIQAQNECRFEMKVEKKYASNTLHIRNLSIQQQTMAILHTSGFPYVCIIFNTEQWFNYKVWRNKIFSRYHLECVVLHLFPPYVCCVISLCSGTGQSLFNMWHFFFLSAIIFKPYEPSAQQKAAVIRKKNKKQILSYGEFNFYLVNQYH